MLSSDRMGYTHDEQCDMLLAGGTCNGRVGSAVLKSVGIGYCTTKGTVLITDPDQMIYTTIPECMSVSRRSTHMDGCDIKTLRTVYFYILCGQM
jgi:hypothetical protein